MPLRKLSLTKKIIIYVLITLACTFSLWLLCTGVLWLICWFFNIYSFHLELQSTDIVSIILSQVSSTFIVLSLTSILSTNVGKVYWQDIKDIRLVKPFFTCFYALTTYLITSMVVSIAGFLAHYRMIVLSSFGFSVITLIFLTAKMLSVYFGRDSIKNDLRWEYFETYNKSITDMTEISGIKQRCQNLKKEYENNNIYLNKKQRVELDKMISNLEEVLDGTNIIPYWFDVWKGKREKTKYTDGLIENTLQALSENNRTIVKENVELLLVSGDTSTFCRIADSLIDDWPEYAVEIIGHMIKKTEESDKKIRLNDYARANFRKLIKAGCSNRLLYLSLLSQKYKNNEKEELIECLKKEMTMDEIQKVEEKYKDNAMIDVYFPYSELLETYSCHNYSMCTQIIDVMYMFYYKSKENDFFTFVKLDDKYKDESGIYSQEILNLKYLPDETWSELERFIKMDEELHAIPNEKKERLKEMKSINITMTWFYDVNPPFAS